MKKQLFKNTSLKLAGTYLMVVMFVSLIFSASLYRILGTEIDRNYARAVDFADRFGGFRPDPVQRTLFLQDREEEHDRSKNRLVSQLVTINIVIIGVGGVLCYVLARRTLRPIEEAHEALERFTSDAAHELRTPLATMRAEIEVALMNKKMTVTDAQALLTSNLEEVDRLTHLSERLLLLARLEEDGLPKQEVNVATAVNKALEVVTASASAKSITLVNKSPKKSDFAVLADEPSLTELLVILLDNAIKYSATKTKVIVKITQENKQIKLAVTDEGVGIGEEDLPYIFDRFYRADSSRTGGEAHGYGLGLALAQKIAHLHNGTITVASKKGKGSAFTVVLPLAG